MAQSSRRAAPLRLRRTLKILMRTTPVSLRKARVLTTLAAIGVCAFAVLRGWSIAGFSIAQMRASEDLADAARPWTEVAGLATAALEASVPVVDDPTDLEGARKRASTLSAALKEHPLSSE